MRPPSLARRAAGKTRAVPRPQQQQPHLHAHAHAPGLGARPALPLENAHQDTRAAAGRATHGACPIPWCTSFRQPNRCAASALAQGFEAHLSSKEALRKRALRSWKPEDRWFSLSSTSSPVVRAWHAHGAWSLPRIPWPQPPRGLQGARGGGLARGSLVSRAGGWVRRRRG
jgi:hypothetical protein